MDLQELRVSGKHHDYEGEVNSSVMLRIVSVPEAASESQTRISSSGSHSGFSFLLEFEMGSF